MESKMKLVTKTSRVIRLLRRGTGEQYLLVIKVIYNVDIEK